MLENPNIASTVDLAYNNARQCSISCCVDVGVIMSMLLVQDYASTPHILYASSSLS